ncbi:Cof-type HAD-IIB family hydrolase [Lactococcus muris]|uniref:Cof-type HAD-IIB family hydrolase n=1 Tax=Lactococcus muris TaxID=2941330 RepID=A0ABV4DAN1_9LACT|nr:Cof-type HAD-IIB family hydrolase [Lactococcus garvieae]
MIKLIALDLDGTLLNSKKKISAQNIEAIQAARQKGVEVVLTTGRPLAAIQPFLETLEMLDFDDFSITFNGGLVQRNTGEILSKKVLSYDDIRLIKQETSALGIPCDILSDDIVYVTESARPSQYTSLNSLLEFHPVSFDQLPQDGIYNKIVSCTDADFLDAQIRKFPKELFERFEIFKTRDILLEFMPKGINKAFGLSKLIEQLGLTPDNVMAMGDEENDLSMISWAGYGVAMKNAVPTVKKAANIISDFTNDQHAVAQVIQEYIL